jgi:hypothetical protein
VPVIVIDVLAVGAAALDPSENADLLVVEVF